MLNEMMMSVNNFNSDVFGFLQDHLVLLITGGIGVAVAGLVAAGTADK